MRSKDSRGSPQTNGNREPRPLFASIRAVAEALTRAMDGAATPTAYRGWEVPRMRESRGEVIVSVKLPGVSREDIRINVSEESITIFAERNRGAKYKGKDGTGGPYGIFTHTLSLAAPVDAKKARASYRGGILTICAPKVKRDEGR